ncbi:hypothetical protein ERICIV_01883 [Paenibacillus larvae subsp. larvae]|uniref:Uncharacterized protein n=1 Tax=Paenibacillus larvae subsp. larvae TaxID=147375 RepID=A0A2L1UD13_9BACL|nr:hypothetical protein ERICIII_01862 [Paenibacillus larvae subsp. larvae]AVF30814.1 hypothetical protein ERICIV_01883 [Paenibacillus larvae subsp. larvae]
MFQFIEKTFDQVPFFKEPPVGYTLNGSMFTAGNDGTGLLFFQQRNNFIGIVPTISQDVFTFDIKGLQNFVSDYAIVDVSCRHFEFERIAEGVHYRVDFGG